MISKLIILAQPFVVFTSIITAMVVAYAVIGTVSRQLTLWWLMVGISIVAIALAFENAIFLYARISGGSIYDSVSNSSILYAIKLVYGFGMWLHLCAALSAIFGYKMSGGVVFKGLIAWALSYIVAVLVYFNA
jgi:hypothetical protein